MASEGDEYSRVRRERDLYRRLLDLGSQEDLESFLREALTLIVETTDATHGYLALNDESDGPGWSIAHGLSKDEIDGVVRLVSRGIVAEALATGETVNTPSAVLDPRFGKRESVRRHPIRAVLCAPIGTPPRGVLYLHGEGESQTFSDADRSCAETFARHLAPLADLMLARHRRQSTDDPTRTARARLRLEGVIGRSAALGSVLDQIALVAPLEISVLLTGDSGTGKSQLARVIHENSPRAPYPFIELNCAALPEGLLESELFGALPGAHSTASRKIEGKVAGAEHGTLFLDEVGELSAPAQAKLLQLLHSKVYYPLGSTRPVQADVRVLAATNTDLERAVAERRFREDLYYRLRVLPLRVPALEERREDIALLTAHFSADASRRHGLPQEPLSPNALRALESAQWPGNVRELSHVVEAAVIRAAGEHAAQVETCHLFPDVAKLPAGCAGGETFQEATRRFQADLLRRALQSNNWNIVETSRRLDLARSQIYKLINVYGIERSGKKDPAQVTRSRPAAR
jgi:Nif-specific regulatory protein